MYIHILMRFILDQRRHLRVRFLCTTLFSTVGLYEMFVKTTTKQQKKQHSYLVRTIQGEPLSILLLSLPPLLLLLLLFLLLVLLLVLPAVR